MRLMRRTLAWTFALGLGAAGANLCAAQNDTSQAPGQPDTDSSVGSRPASLPPLRNGRNAICKKNVHRAGWHQGTPAIAKRCQYQKR